MSDKMLEVVRDLRGLRGAAMSMGVAAMSEETRHLQAQANAAFWFAVMDHLPEVLDRLEAWEKLRPVLESKLASWIRLGECYDEFGDDALKSCGERADADDAAMVGLSEGYNQSLHRPGEPYAGQVPFQQAVAEDGAVSPEALGRWRVSRQTAQERYETRMADLCRCGHRRDAHRDEHADCLGAMGTRGTCLCGEFKAVAYTVLHRNGVGDTKSKWIISSQHQPRSAADQIADALRATAHDGWHAEVRVLTDAKALEFLHD